MSEKALGRLTSPGVKQGVPGACERDPAGPFVTVGEFNNLVDLVNDLRAAHRVGLMKDIGTSGTLRVWRVADADEQRR